MKKLTIDNGKLKIMIAIFAFSLSIINSQFSISSAFALDSTPSADIKSKLDEFKKEIASKAAQLKQVVDRKLKDKAYVGTVKTVSDNSLTLAAESGPKMVSTNQDTVFESQIKSKQKFSQKTLSEENYIAALGDIDETGVLIAKKIILLLVPTSEPKTFLWGKIISISDQLVTLKDKGLKNIASSLPDTATVSLNDFVILTGNKGKNDIFNAGFVYVIPQGGILKAKKAATPSAKLATPSAKPIPKKTS